MLTNTHKQPDYLRVKDVRDKFVKRGWIKPATIDLISMWAMEFEAYRQVQTEMNRNNDGGIQC